MVKAQNTFLGLFLGRKKACLVGFVFNVGLSLLKELKDAQSS